MPWPSCWCAWQVPDGVSALALKAYLDAAYGSDGPPATFEADLDVATLLWCVLSVSWFLPAALDANSAHNTDDARMPGRWTLILARLALAAGVSASEPLTTWAESLRAALLALWGDRPYCWRQRSAGCSRCQDAVHRVALCQKTSATGLALFYAHSSLRNLDLGPQHGGCPRALARDRYD